jgi:hypothetical protein
MHCNTHIGVDIQASLGPVREDTHEHPIWHPISWNMAIESEPLEKLLARRDWYLSGVNVWLGFKYWREEGKWWMGLWARRSLLGEVSNPNDLHCSNSWIGI